MVVVSTGTSTAISTSCIVVDSEAYTHTVSLWLVDVCGDVKV